MPELRTDGGQAEDSTSRPFGGAFDVEELRRRNRVSVGMDVLYLVTTGFFAILAIKGFWPALIAGIPLATLLYFGWSSSKAFFIAQLLAIVVAVLAEFAGLIPL